MASPRVTQQFAETLKSGAATAAPAARVTQQFAETLKSSGTATVTPHARITQQYVEVLRSATSVNTVSIDQSLFLLSQSIVAQQTTDAVIHQVLPGISSAVVASTTAAEISTIINSGRAIYLVELYPYNRLTAAVEELDFSDAGYVSPPGGAKENTYFEGRVTQPLHLTRTIPVTPEASRRIALEIAGIEIINTDGVFDDYLRNYSIDGRQIVVKVGLREWRYDQFVTVFQGRGSSWQGGLDTFTITAREQTHRLDIPLQTEIYGGTGGLDGTAEVAGKPKPLCYGTCSNVTPVLIDPVNLVYQVHPYEIQGVDAVYDRGAALSDFGNTSAYADLISAPISVGEYVTFNNGGVFRIGSVPSGLVTADVRGEDNTSLIPSGIPLTTFQIARYVLQSRGGLSSVELDTDAFDDMDASVPGAAGWFHGTDTMNVDDALAEIIEACAAYWGGTPEGLITVGRLESPDPTNVSLELAEYDLLDIAIVDPPPQVMPPRFRQSVSYAKNWTVQRGEDLAATVTASRRQFLAEPYSVVSSDNPTTQTSFILAQLPPLLESLFVSSSDAQGEADRLKDMLSVPSQCVEVRFGFNGYLIELGSTVKLTHRRINGGNPWFSRVISQEIDARNRALSAVLWGPI